MAIWHYTAGQHYAVYCCRGELSKRKAASDYRGQRTATAVFWALTSLGMLCEPHSEVEQYPVTRWLFNKNMWTAVQRIFEVRMVPLQQMLPDDVKERVFAVMRKERQLLHDDDARPPEVYGAVVPCRREDLPM